MKTRFDEWMNLKIQKNTECPVKVNNVKMDRNN